MVEVVVEQTDELVVIIDRFSFSTTI